MEWFIASWFLWPLIIGVPIVIFSFIFAGVATLADWFTRDKK